MKLFLLISSFTLILINLNGQEYDANIENFILKTNQDSLIKTIRELTGEDSVIISGVKTQITHRISQQNNDLAADYITQRLSCLNLNTYSHEYSNTGKNIIAVQEGVLYPEKKFILCAHYDAVAEYCADDNASGVATVLETARILTKHKFDYTIIYAFWDEEETGLIGSSNYAQQAATNNEDILTVVNLDMLGWDENDDGTFDIHIKNSLDTLNTHISNISSTYNLNLTPNIINPGTWASDHGSFWQYNFEAIIFGESFFGGDYNPFYHTKHDRIEEFNIPYYVELSKLSVGTMAHFAKPSNTNISSNNNNLAANNYQLSNYPNPFNTNTILYYKLATDGFVKISIIDCLGKPVKTLVNNYCSAGSHNINIEGSDLKTGVYFIVLNANNYSKTHQVIVSH